MKKCWIFLMCCFLSVVCMTNQQVMAAPETEGVGEVTTPQLDELSPKLMISSYKISKGELIPGEEFTLKLTIKNTNPYVGVENAMISYVATNNTVYPVFGESNQKFIGKIDGGKSIIVELPMTVADKVSNYLVTVNFVLDYANSISGSVTASSSIVLPIYINNTMNISSLSVARASILGSKSLISVVYSNTGANELRNIIMHLEGDIPETQKAVSLGDLKVNGQGIRDYYVNFNQEGEQKLAISFTYEDEKGAIYNIPATEYITVVNQPPAPVMEPTQPNTSYQDTGLGFELWQWMVIGGVVIGVIIIILIVIRIKNQRNF